jgi:esterase/lipase
MAVRYPDSLSQWPAWLAARERRAGVADTGVMQRVVFADSLAPQRTPWSVVYLHGFSATRQETAPVSELVAQALGANLFETRLHGHGLPGDSLGAATAEQWIADAEAALAAGARLGDSVLVISTSTGGTLAAWLGARPPSGVRPAAVVMISPNFAVKGASARVLSWPWAPIVLPRLMPDRSWKAQNAARARYWTTSYPTAALFPMVALVDAVNALPLDRWTTPTLVLVHDDDPVVDAEATHEWVQRLRGATSARVDVAPVVPIAGEDPHVLAGRIAAPGQVAPVVKRIVDFVRAH